MAMVLVAAAACLLTGCKTTSKTELDVAGADSIGYDFFNLSKNPGELRDLSAEQPDKLQEMVALWKQYSEENGVLDIVPEVAK